MDKKIILFAIYCSLILTACIKADECDTSICGNEKFLIHELTTSNYYLSNHGQGKAKYIWYSNTVDACGQGTSSMYVHIDIDESQKVVPIEVLVTTLTGGKIQTRTLTEKSDGQGNTFYDEAFEVSLFNDISGCFGDVQLRAQINFESLGSSVLDDVYLTTLMKGGMMQFTYIEHKR